MDDKGGPRSNQFKTERKDQIGSKPSAALWIYVSIPVYISIYPYSNVNVVYSTAAMEPKVSLYSKAYLNVVFLMNMPHICASPILFFSDIQKFLFWIRSSNSELKNKLNLYWNPIHFDFWIIWLVLPRHQI